jgi:subtilisin family serine protease
MQVPSVWSRCSGRGIKVAILADGVDGNSPDLIGKVSQGGSNRVPGQFGYGTNMALLIAGTANNGFGGTGIAPDASILDVQVLQASATPNPDTVLQGIQLAQQQGARIIVLAFTREFYEEFANQTEYNAVNNSLKDFHDNHNGLVFMSAGDGHTRTNSAQRLDHINLISGFDRMLGLGNSNTGTNITMSGNRTGPGWYEDTNGTALNSSMYAAAELAGVAALIWSANLSASNLQVENALKNTAANSTPPTAGDPHPWNPNYGFGFPNANAALNTLPASAPWPRPYSTKKCPIPDGCKIQYQRNIPQINLH